ncbi:MAG: SDR family oxidoreductase [Thermomicrobiales bacterium]
MSDHTLRDRFALVTGAGSGLGRATALRLAQAGAGVACMDLKNDQAAQTVQEITAAGGQALALAGDVSDERTVSDAVQAAYDRWHKLDIAINCAGVDYVLGVTDFSAEQWDRVLGVNLRGPFLVARAVFPLMQAAGGGDIVNVASTAALRAWGNASAYHASKWGLVGFSRGLGVEGRPHNIRVTTMIPGGMQTHWFDAFPEQGIPLPDAAHLQDPATVADTIAYAVGLPRGSAVQEILVTPVTETSWP